MTEQHCKVPAHIASAHNLPAQCPSAWHMSSRHADGKLAMSAWTSLQPSTDVQIVIGRVAWLRKHSLDGKPCHANLKCPGPKKGVPCLHGDQKRTRMTATRLTEACCWVTSWVCKCMAEVESWITLDIQIQETHQTSSTAIGPSH